MKHQWHTPPAISPETSSEEVTRLMAERASFEQSRFAKNTVLGYGYDWKMFCAWCESRQRPPLPATEETVSLYLTDLLIQGKKLSTVGRRNCAIAHKHRVNKFPSPVTRAIVDMLYCVQRQRGEKPRQMRALGLEELRAISVKLLEESRYSHARPVGRRQWESTRPDVCLRNRALMVVGFCSALRRSNLASLLVTDVEFTAEGLTLRINREKQDQKGKGRIVGLPFGKHADTCPVLVLRAWLDHRHEKVGPLFPRLNPKNDGEPLSGGAVLRIVKKCVKLINLDPTDFGGHSLRAGFVTAAGDANIGTLRIAAHTGQSPAIVERYFRRNDPFRNNVCGGIDF